MLAASKYPQDYVDACRARTARQVATYKKVATAAGTGKALDAFEPEFFNDLVVVLECSFVHRLRGAEGKDGNTLNEVRALASSIIEHDGVLTIEKSMKLKPEASVLGLAAGDTIALDAKQFQRLADAFFAEIEQKFT